MRRIVSLAVCAVLLVGCSSSGHDAPSTSAGQSGEASPGDESAEAGFVRDMSVHHAQAVAMAEAIRDRTEDPELKLLATDIALGQQNQIGRMTGWLDQWGLSVSSANEAMAWMSGHDGMVMTQSAGSVPGLTDGLMPGMARGPRSAPCRRCRSTRRKSRSCS